MAHGADLSAIRSALTAVFGRAIPAFRKPEPAVWKPAGDAFPGWTIAGSGTRLLRTFGAASGNAAAFRGWPSGDSHLPMPRAAGTTPATVRSSTIAYAGLTRSREAPTVARGYHACESDNSLAAPAGNPQGGPEHLPVFPWSGGMGLPSPDNPDFISVWIVEDHRDTRETIKELIDSEPGMACTEAFESAEALLDHLEHHFVPEVIICDIGLPGMTGIELVQRLRPLATGTKVVMLTVHEDKERILDTLRAGASGYLSKPPSAAELVGVRDEDGVVREPGAIRDVMSGGAVMSPRVARKVLEIFAQQTVSPFDYQLTAREQDVLNELVEGKSKKRIARDLSLSVSTVDTHLRSIYAKLHVNTQTAAVAKAFREGLVR